MIQLSAAQLVHTSKELTINLSDRSTARQPFLLSIARVTAPRDCVTVVVRNNVAQEPSCREYIVIELRELNEESGVYV